MGGTVSQAHGQLEKSTQQACSAILRALWICREPRFRTWAEGWLWGLDRTRESAEAAIFAVGREAAVKSGKAEIAALAGRAAAWAAWTIAAGQVFEIAEVEAKIAGWVAEAGRLADIYES